MCVCVCVCVRVNSIKYYRYPLSIYLYFDPYKSLNGCYDIRLETSNKFSVINRFPRNFGLLLSYHQECVYCRITIQHSIYFGVTFFISFN